MIFRRRRRRWRTLPAGLPPDASEIEPDPSWSPQVRAWFERVWLEPFAVRYIRSDAHGIRYMARLLEEYLAGPVPERRFELFAWADCYGLTPESRVYLGWAREAKPSPADIALLL